jgi:hypothetical protein
MRTCIGECWGSRRPWPREGKQKKIGRKKKKAQGEAEENKREAKERIFLPRFGSFQGVMADSKQKISLRLRAGISNISVA